MSEAKFTPGPWMTRYNGAYGHLIIGGDKGGNVVATVHLKDAYKTTEQGSSNARLITAAPALYEAAREAVNLLDADVDNALDAIIGLRAALALVESEAA